MSVARSRLYARSRTTARKARMPAFYAVTVAFVAFLVAAMNEPMQFAVLAWTPDYGFFTHRVHHVMIGGLLVLLTTSVAVQLYRPVERVGAYLFAALAVGSLAIVSVVVDGLGALAELAIFIVPLVVLGVLHPGLRSFRPTRETIDGRLLAVAAVAAVPLVAFAALQTNLQLTLSNDHVAFTHYVFMAAGAVTIGVGALVASTRPTGVRFLVYSAAVLVALVGVASMLYPEPVQGVNFGVIGGGLAVLWAVCLVAVAELGSRQNITSEPEFPDDTA